MKTIRPLLLKSVIKQEIFHIIVVDHCFVDSGKCNKMRKNVIVINTGKIIYF